MFGRENHADDGGRMTNRAEALTLLAEVRGRLDELEHLIRTAPDPVVPTPSAFHSPGVETLTPPGYQRFLREGVSSPEILNRYEAFRGFIRFGTADTRVTARFEPFPLSDLHRVGTETAPGLRIIPQIPPNAVELPGGAQKWFVFELLAETINAAEFEWIEWVLKLSVDEVVRVAPRFVVTQAGKTERIALAVSRVTEFATFLHCRLDRPMLEALPDLDLDSGAPVQVRMNLSTQGGRMVPMTLHRLAVYGKRLAPKGGDPDAQI
jgi:hypothetical protein